VWDCVYVCTWIMDIQHQHAYIRGTIRGFFLLHETCCDLLDRSDLVRKTKCGFGLLSFEHFLSCLLL
jgi:hypothetical protein